MPLIEALGKGWSQHHGPQAQEFVHRWGEKFGVDPVVKQTADNSLRFTTDLSNIRLHGMAETQCLLLGGEGTALIETLRAFKQHAGETGGVPFVLATSAAAYAQSHTVFPPGKCLRLSPPHLDQLLASPEPELHLKQWLREQIPLRRLIPYNHLLSVAGGMFFGRSSELDKLSYEDDLSFAVAGPGRIGKTSLVKQYLRQLLKDRDPQASRSFYIDFYHCSKDATSVARFLAIKLDPTKRGSEMTANRLQDFLLYQRSKHGGPLNLLLDEVDQVCESETFSVLGEAAKLGYCRLVLIGKGDLLRLMLYSNSQLKQRLQLLQLNPLDEPSARALLLEPLGDLGFKIADRDRLVDQIFRLTGRLPHLMQFFARKLVETAIDENLETISIAQVEALKWDFETAQFFISPLQGLEDPEARLIALLLLKERQQDFSPVQIRTLVARWGLLIDEMQTLRLCNELVIENVLVWNRGAFRLANEALVDYARHLGILESALEAARRNVQSASNKIAPRHSVR